MWGLTSSGAWSNPLVTIPLVWARSGDLNDPKDPNVFTFSRPENVAAFQWVHDLRWKERLAAGTNEERGGVNGFDAIFTTGSAAMHVGTTAGLGAWKDRAQTNWDIVALPSGPCGRGEQASVDGYAIPAGTKTPDASWVAVHGLTDRDSNKLMAQTTGLCPGRKSQFGAWVDTIPGRSLRRALPTEATRPSPDALWPKAADVVRSSTRSSRSTSTRTRSPSRACSSSSRPACPGCSGPAPSGERRTDPPGPRPDRGPRRPKGGGAPDGRTDAAGAGRGRRVLAAAPLAASAAGERARRRRGTPSGRRRR